MGMSFFPQFHAEEEIQKVIFDEAYLEYIKGKQKF